jgi:hypothetical protein
LRPDPYGVALDPYGVALEGYKSELVIQTGQGPGIHWLKGYDDTDNYVFRIRPEIDKDKVKRAIYGKILGPIKLEPRKDPARLYFKYYLNPDGTRNLEHDPRRNLFYEGLR